jgi:hypothetical protein
MKKLVKKSLDELAEIMPVLSEKNQHECVGGYYFVDETYGSGFLETTDGSDLIVVATSGELQAYWDNGTIPVYSSYKTITPQSNSIKEATYLNIALNVNWTAFSGVEIISNSYSPTVSYANGILTVNDNNDYNTLRYKDAMASAISGLLISGDV